MSIQRFVLAAGIALAALMTGCAHPVSVTASDFNKIKASSDTKIQKSVGFYIAAEDFNREVTTAGGGGDKVSYKPYKDLEPGLYKALSEVFASVSKLDSPKAGDNINLVIIPKITTNSSSDSMLTWPPTLFTVELTCKVTDKAGADITEVKAQGTGRAEFSEFKSDVSLSAKRAAQEAMVNLVKALEASPKLKS
jgi:hypothetical protein